MEQPVLRRTESHFPGADGLVLFRRSWLPETVCRVVVVVHGYAEHSGRYEEFARWFAGRGAAVHAYDHRGHGRSAGRRCHVTRFSEFLDDLECFLQRVRSEHPADPISLVGHSMGGLITAAFLTERKPVLANAVLSGPALAVGEGVTRLRRTAVRLFRGLLPRLVLGSGLDPNGLSRDPQVVRAYLEDPFVFRTMTVSLASELLRAVRRTAAHASEVDVPLLVLHGEDDTLCPPRGSRDFFEGVCSSGSAFHVYPGLRHEIFNEPERKTVYGDVWAWLTKVSP